MRPTDTEYKVNLEEEQHLHEVNVKRANATFTRLMILVEYLKSLKGVSNIKIDNTDLDNFDRRKYNPTWPFGGYIMVVFTFAGENQQLVVK